MNENFFFALFLTTLAGISTGFGSLISVLFKRQNFKFLVVSLGFSAGVMIYISFVEILQQSIELCRQIDTTVGKIIPILSFFIGIFMIAAIDYFIPQNTNPHEFSSMKSNSDNLMRTGVFTAIVIAIHNFPEGIATFMTAVSSPNKAILVAFAIALHNIPEGMAVGVPIYHATGSKKKAILYSFLSGIAEPIGGVFGFLLVAPFLNDIVLAAILAGVAGIMVYIYLSMNYCLPPKHLANIIFV